MSSSAIWTDEGPPLRPQEWLIRRLKQPKTRFESQLYGPHCALLSHYFPYQRQFLVKPQSKILPEYEPMSNVSFSSACAETSFTIDDCILESSTDHIADLSLSSTGVPIIPHSMGGPSGAVYIPDFIVAKATEFSNADESILIVEDKRGYSLSTSQLADYMDA
jgi:hypothetical protein